MKAHLAAGTGIVAAVELVALLLPERRFLPWISGAALALALSGMRHLLAPGREPVPASTDAEDAAESLRRWRSGTETLIRWSESTRADWDRHLRPLLARRFETATGQSRAHDPAALDATGEMLFGPDLWRWVDQENIAQNGGREPGPGRSALAEILQRLEQL